MPTTIACPACGTTLDLGQDLASLAGARIECTRCHAEFHLPAAAPAPAEPPPAVERPRLRLRTNQTTLATANTRQTCPHCHAEIDAGAVFCIACGINFQTGEHAQLAQEPVVSPWRQIGRIAVVVGSLAVIFGSLWSIYAGYRREKVLAQTMTLRMVLYAANATHDYARSIERLETGIAANPWATNRTEAAESLAHLRTELAQVPTRTAALAPDIARAKTLTNQVAALAELQAAVARNPGATNETEALALIATWQQQLQQVQFRDALARELTRAQAAQTPAEAVQILQQALRQYGNAPNASAARQALSEYQKQVGPPAGVTKP